MNEELAPQDARQALQRLEASSIEATPSPDQMLWAIVKGGVTAENVGAFEQLVKLSEHMEDRKAAKSASRCLRELQADAKHIAATKAVPDKQGNVKYRYAPYEEIMAQAQPLLTKHGFSARFSQKMEADRVTVTCVLMHDDGHSFTNDFTVRVGSGPPNASAPQADAGAGTTAQREAFCDALNIVRSHDADARLEGSPEAITPEQAADLERRVIQTNSDRAAFLKFAGAASFAEVKAGSYDKLDGLLARKERK